VQADRFEHCVRKERAQKGQGVVLVQVVDAAFGRRLALPVQQMPEVVQQRRRHEFCACARVLRERRCLQGMLELRDGFAAVGEAAVCIEEMPDVGDRKCHRVVAR
jgi:hypothetical protein